MIIYKALYNHMIYESSAETVSIHKTKQGARNALAKRVKKEHENHNKMLDYDVDEMGSRFGIFEAWLVGEAELLD